MDISAEKIDLIQWLSALTDEHIIQQIKSIKAKSSTDWWNEISEKERQEILEGISQADRGELTPNEEVLRKYSKWL